MKVMVVGSGGREHALVWKLSQSELVDKIYALPGNPGIAEIAECADISVKDVEKIADFAQRQKIDLTVVGPEAPIVAGIADEFKKRGLNIFAPSSSAARLEGSKAFAKMFMREHGIPTAEFEIFDDPDKAEDYIKKVGAPIVVKADGLAAGKGVVVADTLQEALSAVDRIMRKKVFGDAGKKVVVERRLYGRETSYLVISDGKSFVPLAPARDYKPVYDGDKGPNTGGMGAYSPAETLTRELEKRVQKEIVIPVIEGMSKGGTPFVGVLYVGLMISEGKPYVLEFNVRFGDPETQAILRRLRSDLVEVATEAISGNLRESLQWDERPSVCVVLASEGYPLKYETGKVIEGINEAKKIEGVEIFHAGTAVKGGKLVTAGGRVLNVTAVGNDFKQARDRAYEAVDKIYFEGMHYRKDIAAEVS